MDSQQLKCHSTTGTNKKNTEGMVDNQSYTLVSHKHNRKHTLGTKKTLSQTNKHRQNVKDTTNAKKKTLNMPETKSKKRKNTQEKMQPDREQQTLCIYDTRSKLPGQKHKISSFCCVNRPQRCAPIGTVKKEKTRRKHPGVP